MKRIPVISKHLPGHWWFEINGAESYGWYPVSTLPVALLFGVPGELNGQTNHPGGTATRDPHHGDSAPVMFSPMTQDGDCRSDEQIQDCLRSFAQSYGVSHWDWRWPGAPNCHTLQMDAMNACNLSQPGGDTGSQVWG
jgi:hypothetical protein